MGQFELLLDKEKDTLEIFKTPSRTPVQSIQGKYGILLCQDVNDNIVKIIIPEPDILFGVDRSLIENFLINFSL